MTYLDAHVEPSFGWLPPPMHRIAQNKKAIVMPIIDIIEADTFVYRPLGLRVIGFTPSLTDLGIELQKKDMFSGRTDADPRPRPAMAGGLALH